MLPALTRRSGVIAVVLAILVWSFSMRAQTSSTVNSGATLPNGCTQGSVYILTTSLAMSVCSAPNTWTAVPQAAPALHAATHQAGGTDTVKLDTLAAPTDITTLNATSSLHGLLPKLSGALTDVLHGNGTWGSVASGANVAILASPVTNSTTSYADITGLVATNLLGLKNYEVHCQMIYSANATTTGIGISWTLPSVSAAGALMTTGITAQTTAGTTIGGSDTGSTTTASVATSGNIALFNGFFVMGMTSGQMQMRFKSEVAVSNAIIIQPGSWCQFVTY